MNELKEIVNSNLTLIIVKDGSYNQIVFPYNETLLFELLNAVRIESTYSGKFEKVLGNLEIRIVKSSEFKHITESHINSEEV